MSIFQLHQGTIPMLVSLPHDGTALPESLAARMTPTAQRVPDTDWHVARLYAFARTMGASVIVPKYSRYVVDLNRPPDDISLYPGQNTTGLCPSVQFSGEPVYREGQTPAPDEIAARVETYWRPYHEALRDELERIRALHGRVLLWEGHSIRGEVPFLFDGRLPDFNVGTAGGASCAAAVQQRIAAVLEAQSGYDFVLNGRFKGGYITRHYGDPAHGIGAVQLEISQRIYMDEATFAWDEAKSAAAQTVIQSLIEAALG
ncbi:MAG: N-formylglutamate deformylase [Proteobacteria bacterium]|nr:N-formylglutamate deformylase [Pseudomonadota bacterium]